MNKIEAVMELYQSVFPHVELEKCGTSWIRVYPGDGITPSTPYRSGELLAEIYTETGRMYYWEEEDKEFVLDDSYGEVWNIREPVHVTAPATGKQILAAYDEEEGLFDDIGDV